MGLVILLAVIIILVIILFIFYTHENEKHEDKEKNCFEDKITLILDKLQTQDLEDIEKLFREIMSEDTSRIEFYVILANIIRDRGHISEAINMHKNVLKRPDVLEDNILKGWVLGNLAEDFRQGGMIDRALRTYHDALSLLTSQESGVKKSRQNKTLLYDREMAVKIWKKSLLQRYIILCKQVGDYEKLLGLIEMYYAIERDKNEKQGENEGQRKEIAFIYNEMGENELKNNNQKKAIQHFSKAVSIYKRVYPAYINLARVYKESNKRKALKYLDEVIEHVPSRAFLILPLYRELSPERFEDVCFQLLSVNEHDWRVRLELGRYYMKKGEKGKGLLEFKKCLELSPMVLIIHQEIWKYLLKNPDDVDVFREYANTLNKVLVFNNPFICSKCNYKSSEFLWKCPYCHEFDTFVELKI